MHYTNCALRPLLGVGERYAARQSADSLEDLKQK
jgi:hypothetical protein